MNFSSIFELTMVWLVCSLLNLFWYKHYPDVMTKEFRPALIILAPLASFFVVTGMVCVCLYKVPLRIMGLQKTDF